MRLSRPAISPLVERTVVRRAEWETFLAAAAVAFEDRLFRVADRTLGGKSCGPLRSRTLASRMICDANWLGPIGAVSTKTLQVPSNRGIWSQIKGI